MGSTGSDHCSWQVNYLCSTVVFRTNTTSLMKAASIEAAFFMSRMYGMLQGAKEGGVIMSKDAYFNISIVVSVAQQ